MSWGVPDNARAVLVPKLATSFISGVSPVAKKLVGLTVFVAAGGVEKGRLQAATNTAKSTNVEAAAPRFVLAICISSHSSKVLTIVAHPILRVKFWTRILEAYHGLH
jgi:hypothetical protein